MDCCTWFRLKCAALADHYLFRQSRCVSLCWLCHYRSALSNSILLWNLICCTRPACILVGCLVSNYGYGWHTGSIETRTAYKAFTDHEVTAKVGLHIGLRGINITLKGRQMSLDTNIV